ncbi:MAG: DNA translocase FtsK 4TM domain-containing protein [Deltaproteobacteria bacterium]|jgi:S-DNA-T family DNA segregation ATPase FtsK/SpoIIIE|nr:DNA translocase FtsK 4TM domain-containing protein [Deltaproteobacteria bacterium]
MKNGRGKKEGAAPEPLKEKPKRKADKDPETRRKRTRGGAGKAPPPLSAPAPPKAAPGGARLSGLLWLALSPLLFLALLTHDPGDLAAGSGEPRNQLGYLGALSSAFLFRLGGLAAFLPCFISLSAGVRALAGKRGSPWVVLFGSFLAAFSLAALFSMIFPEGAAPFGSGSGGGILGARLAEVFLKLGGRVGSLALLPVPAAAGFLLFTGVTPGALGRFFRDFVLDASEREAEERAPEVKIAAAGDPPAKSPAPELKISSGPRTLPAKPEPLRIREAPASGPRESAGEGGPRRAGKIRPYELPRADLLDPPKEAPGENPSGLTREELARNAVLLETKLKEFGVEGRVLEVSGGPVITMYEYQPAPGVKISKVSNLANDLAMAMRAESIRVVAPIPGKAAIGLELPNPQRAIVTLRELVESQAFRKQRSPLAMVLGVDIVGNPVVTDLGRMPHLLIAGATGSGKSVGLDCMIMSILFKAPPELLRFLMIDPKCVELALYHDMPHLIHPVLTDPGEATTALKWAVHEMDERYRRMAENGVRNIQGYNELMAKNSGGAKNHSPDVMPYLVIVIDELSDLMIQAPKDVETSIMRLSAKARAAGIHLILATQRPSVDVLTGVIKANLPTRVSFQVATKVDSRTILDQGGAEQLLGKGDMLFQPPGSAKLTRLHGAYVTDDEKKRVTDHARSFGPPDYLESLETPDKREGGASTECDEKFWEAVELVRSSGKATISFVQRRLGVGYNRAANMIEQMEREGIVGPQEGARPREIL